MNPARQLEQKREASGACIRCGSPLAVVPKRKRVSGRAPSQHICRPCLDRRCASSTASDHRRLEQGLCVRCGIPLVNRTVRECAHCRSRERYWYAKRHGKPLPEILPARTPRPPRRLIPAVGMTPLQLRAELRGPEAAPTRDRRLHDQPKRRCSNCGTIFQPSIRRRMLCSGCFTRGNDAA